MAFPDVTTLLEDGTSLADWTAEPLNFGALALGVTGGLIYAPNGNNESWLNTAQYGPDFCFTLEVPTIVVPSNDKGYWLSWLKDPSGSASTADGYAVLVTINTSLGTQQAWRIARWDNAAATVLGATVDGPAMANGDSIGIEKIGSTIKGFHKPAAGAWTEILSRTDATYAGTGYVAIFCNQSSARLDNLRGGTISAATTPLTLSASQAQTSVLPRQVNKILVA